MTYKLRFLYAAKAAHPAGAVFATLRLTDFCLALTASQTLIRGSLVKLLIERKLIDSMATALSRKFSVAPMMDWTDRHCRYFHRLLSPSTLLYTEMVTTGAIIHGDRDRFLSFNEQEHPVALQLGGSDPQALGQCAQIAQQYGYDEVNLNCGCPSDRVQNGSFGACLMREPERVAQCVAAMINACNIPVTVKCRIGVDDQDEYADLQQFTEAMVKAGCESLTVHARKAWLQGLSPKENRDLPPLNYPRVYQLKADFPELEIVINGGITSIETVERQLDEVDGVMMGRAAYHNPWLLTDVESRVFGQTASFNSPLQALDAFLPYMEEQLHQGVRLSAITKHILGLFQGRPGTKQFKRYISEHAFKKDAGLEVLEAATEHWRSGASSIEYRDRLLATATH